MSTLQRYVPSVASTLLMCGLLCLVYSHYQYYVDPDGTAYLTISQKYAVGDISRAINGYWSPWACWLTAIFIKLGLAAIPASVVVNAMGATGFLFVSQSFFLRFDLAKQMQWLFNITLSLFLVYAIFWQSFDDLWECFFLLAALRVMTGADFKNKPLHWVVYGGLGALAYFAKAYSFPFFILNTVCCTYFICRPSKGLWLKISAASIIVMIACSMPWIIALHSKYHIWTTSTSGPLNTSWYLVGHPYWEGGIQHLVPPFYKDSPSYWEDPYWANGKTPHFWDSWQLFGLQLARIAQNLWKLLKSMLLISVFFPLIAVLLARFVIVARNKDDIPALPNYAVSLSFLLFPLGYILVNFEPRYIWYMLPLSMLAGGVFILNHLSSNADVKILRIVPYLFALSYLAYPAKGMWMMYDRGKSDHIAAQKMRGMGLRGSFASNAKPGLERQGMWRLAYFSGMQYYMLADPNTTDSQIVKGMDQYGVNYFITTRDIKETSIKNVQGDPVHIVDPETMTDWMIYKLH